MVSCLRGTAEVTPGISGLCALGAFVEYCDVSGVIDAGTEGLADGVGAGAAVLAPAGVDLRVTRTVSLRSGTDEVLASGCV